LKRFLFGAVDGDVHGCHFTTEIKLKKNATAQLSALNGWIPFLKDFKQQFLKKYLLINSIN
jgi:hypothetical protein